MAENQNRPNDSNENRNQQNSPDKENDQRTNNKEINKGKKGSSAMATRENVKSDGYGSSQQNDDLNIGPMDAEFDELPSKSRTENQTGPGLG